METLQTLGTALGLGALAGINLYLTVFVAGLAINQGWIALAPEYQSLEVLGHPAIVIIAGVFYFLQFFADKVPWVDSLWDLLHSAVRPIGGAALALTALGTADPVFDVTIALLAGGVALTTHTIKSGTRLIANASPEPISNVALSVTEDVTVIGGLLLVQHYPVIALTIVILLVAALVYFGPKILRAIRSWTWLAWRRLRVPFAAKEVPATLPNRLPADADILLHSLRKDSSEALTVDWALPCITGGSKKTPANAPGYLVALKEDPKSLHFVSKGWLRSATLTLPLHGFKATVESAFLSENLVLYSIENRKKEIFFFERAHRPLLERLLEEIRGRLHAA